MGLYQTGTWDDRSEAGLRPGRFSERVAGRNPAYTRQQEHHSDPPKTVTEFSWHIMVIPRGTKEEEQCPGTGFCASP
jgi:hypothetical protein